MSLNQRVIIALPKGRVYDQAKELLGRAGIAIPGSENGSRKLVFADESGRYDFVPLKPIDIPVYVESGAIDAGIVGTDILRELDSDVYEPVDLRIGLCRLVVAAPQGLQVSIRDLLPRTAEHFFRSRNIHVHIVKLDGSVEIAPLLGLAEAVIDLVETGRTLRENGMRIVEEIAQVSAKLIINRTAMKMKSVDINHLINQMDRVVYENP
jgi:ATP phosphoribosyltransferase